MKAKVLDTGEILDLYPYHSGYWIDLKTQCLYREPDLEFLSGTSEKVIEGWLCKNEYEDGFARIHTEEPQAGLDEMPITGEQLGIWRSNGNIYLISDELFPDLKWTDSPKKVKITITPME